MHGVGWNQAAAVGSWEPSSSLLHRVHSVHTIDIQWPTVIDHKHREVGTHVVRPGGTWTPTSAMGITNIGGFYLELSE